MMTPTLTRNPNFKPGVDSSWDNPPYLDDASNTALFGPRGSNLTYPASLGWGYPMLDSIAVSNATSPPQIVSNAQIASPADIAASTKAQLQAKLDAASATSSVAAPMGLSKAEWIAIAVLVLALLA